ncbi:MAG: phage repressor protein [Sulfuricurvum sp. PC08-66]|nr:MAG: phage repressor protein [Sulfuricurvum sp. PC08-66]
MKSFDDIVEHIKDIISAENPHKKIFDKDVATLLGISQMNFATMKKRDKIPYGELLDFCAKRAISINWLLYGQSPESLIDATDRFYRVRFYSELSASAGGGGEAEAHICEDVVIDPLFLAQLGGEASLKHIEALRVSGDSMEPTFSYDDIIFVNRIMTDISRGGIFTIQTDNGLLVKRLQRRIDGRVDIISDNKEYLVEQAHPSQIHIIGRVVAKFGSAD